MNENMVLANRKNIDAMQDELTALRAENAELVKALENICDQFGTATYANVKAAVIDARAALAKHKKG